MPRSIPALVVLQIITAIAIAFGVVEREAVFFVTAALLLFTVLAPLEDGVALFILSIPFFFALPFSESFDTMANWRIISAVLFMRYIVEFWKDYRLQIKDFRFGLPVIYYPLRVPILFWAVTAFLAWGLISSLQAAYPIVGIKKMLFFTNIFLVFPIIRFIIKKNGINKLLLVTRYSLLVVLTVGFLQLLSLFVVPLETFWRFWAGRVIPVLYGYNLGELLQTSNTWFASGGNGMPTLRMFSVFPDSHSFALFVLLGLVVLIPAWLRNIQGRKYGTHYSITRRYCSKMFMVVLMGFLALIFSGSRGVWLSAVGVVMVFAGFLALMRWKKHEGGYTFYAKSLMTLFVLFGILFLPASIISSLTQRAQGGIADSLSSIKRARSITDLEEISNRSRLQIWKAAFETIVNRPVFGVGPGNFSVALGEDISASRKGASAHNLYLDIASEMGLPGLALFLILVGYILWSLLRGFIINNNLSSYASNPLHAVRVVFFVYFLWILGYSFFDVVLLNDKVLIFATILVAYCHGTTKLEQPNSATTSDATA